MKQKVPMLTVLWQIADTVTIVHHLSLMNPGVCVCVYIAFLIYLLCYRSSSLDDLRGADALLCLANNSCPSSERATPPGEEIPEDVCV